jgi:26S proteasome regulatory subunit N9
MEYHKACGTASQYFRNALAYLGYVKAAAAALAPSSEERVVLASDVALAALIGEEIFNFGELLQHDIVAALEGSSFAWLAPLLTAFSAGDIGAFDRCMSEQAARQPVLASNAVFLSQKIRLMALVEMVFRRTADNRTLSFADIGAHCRVGDKDVEPLVMKAMSMSLVRGVVDQVAQTVRITWACPRVLDRQQLAQLRDRMGEWAAHVDRTSVLLESNAPELFL